MNFTAEELIELEKQLSKPQGQNGVKVAENMNETNIKVTLDAIETLSLKESETILEIGHGNCGHLKSIYNVNNKVKYYGLEISETMKNEAERINKILIQKHQVSFYLYDGVKIPFSDNFFDKIFTVNTIYFWKNPSEFISEIHRVLKINGTLVIGFAQKDFMKKLPFINNMFRLYNTNDINILFKNKGLKITETITKNDIINSKLGQQIERIYTVVKIKKEA